MHTSLTASAPVSRPQGLDVDVQALGEDSFCAQDLAALDWLRRGVLHILEVSMEPPDLPQWVKRINEGYEAIAQALALQAPDLTQKVQAFIQLLAPFRHNNVYLLMGFHGAIMFEGDQFGYFEFDSPQMARDKIVEFLRLSIENRVPVNLEFEVSSLKLLSARYPEMKELIERAMREGLTEIINPTYSHPYAHLVGAESNIRQFEYGIEVMQEMFGPARPGVYAFSESAVHPQTPQILRFFGIPYSTLRSRLQGFGPTAPHPLVEWEGLDGSRVRGLAHQTNAYAGEYYCSGFYKEIFSQLIQTRSGSPRYYNVLTSIVDHTVEMEDNVDEAFRASRFGPFLGRHMTYTQLFEQGPVSHGVYRFPYDHFDVSRMPCELLGGLGLKVRRALAATERLTLQVESLLGHLTLAGVDVQAQAEALRECWRTLLLCQNHDSIAVPYHTQGQYHRERLHLSPDFAGYINQIPQPSERIGDKTLALLEAADRRLEDLARQALAVAGGQNGKTGVRAVLNPHGWAVEDAKPGLSPAPAEKHAGHDGPILWNAVEQGDALLLTGPGGLELTVQVLSKEGAVQPLRPQAGQNGARNAWSAGPHAALALGSQESEALALEINTTADGLQLKFSGFAPGLPIWGNYPMGAEPTRKRMFNVTDYAWVRGAFMLLGEACPYYNADLDGAWVAADMHDRGLYTLKLVSDTAAHSLGWAGRRMVEHQVPVRSWTLPGEGRLPQSGLLVESESIFVQALIPTAQGLVLRLMNYSDQPEKARVSLPVGWALGERINGYGEPEGEQPQADSVSLGAWTFATFTLRRA